MIPDVEDTIVAVATPRGPAPRGVVRIAGPRAVAVAEGLAARPLRCADARRFGGVMLRFEVDGAPRGLPADVFVWPDARSYTRQPAVEVHTVGSPPVLDALTRACVAHGARPAEPGEFTLRALLAGRIDLPQAEAVLAVVDAPDERALERALRQLAGGLSSPLHRLRADLLGLLADLEAGLDFVEEEDVRFVSAEELRRRLAEARDLVAATLSQVAERDESLRPPTVALAGAPNVGKSSLFNALVERFAASPDAPRAIVADVAGVTRDPVIAEVRLAGVPVLLVDTAGDDESAPRDEVDAAARRMQADVVRGAAVVVSCRRADGAATPPPAGVVAVATMSDRFAPSGEAWLATSAATGEGLDDLAHAVIARLASSASDPLAATAERCRVGLTQAAGALDRALAASREGDELVALELRDALEGLGRVVGEVVNDEVLGEIFSRFCIGK